MREIKSIEEQGTSLEELSKHYGSIETLMKMESVPQILGASQSGSIVGHDKAHMQS